MDKEPAEKQSSDHEVFSDLETEKLRELRKLIVGPEKTQLDSLQARFLDPASRARDLSEVLPDAIVLGASKDDRLTRALAPTVDKAVHTSVRKNPKALAQALFPIIGPAIRKSITETHARMIQSLNQTLEHSFSIKGLKWRLEAWRTGRSFGEIVLLHTLQFRVEQIFLIHLPSGLPISHRSLDLSREEDPDLVSAMLTAIQDFVKDSFSVEEGSDLKEFQVGDLSVWIENSPSAALAAVIRGNPPLELRDCLQSSLENIAKLFSQELHDFDGDNSTLTAAEVYLEECLIQRKKAERKPILGALIAGIAILGLVILLGIWFYTGYVQQSKWDQYLTRLEEEPGLVVTASKSQGGKLLVYGLKDPDSTDSASIQTDAGIESEEVIEKWEPYLALHPEITKNRVVRYLNPPETVGMQVTDGVLLLTGSASKNWIDTNLVQHRYIPGIREIQYEGLALLEIESIQQLQTSIHSTRILFDVEQSELRESEVNKLQQVVKSILDAIRTAQGINVSFMIEINGHADASGTELFNRLLSQSRADRIRSALISAGIPEERIITHGVGFSEEDARLEATYQRSVTFTTTITKESTP